MNGKRIAKIKIWIKIKKLFYRYGLKKEKTIEDFYKNIVAVFNRLPKEEKQKMRQMIQSILDIYQDYNTKIHEKGVHNGESRKESNDKKNKKDC